MAVLACLVWATLAECTASVNPWQHFDEYAPVVQFNKACCRYRPRAFPGDGVGSACYVNIQQTTAGGYVFQYWFYYAKDVRIDEYTDTQLKRLLALIAEKTNSQIDSVLQQAFHSHDWELVEVHVSTLGEMPTKISFCSHGQRYDLKPNTWPIGATMKGKRCVVKVISDMHGSYPAGLWTPANSGWASLHANAEFLIVLAKETALRSVGVKPVYEEVQFAGRCKQFSERVKRVSSLPDYPYRMPWNRRFRYSEHEKAGHVAIVSVAPQSSTASSSPRILQRVTTEIDDSVRRFNSAFVAKAASAEVVQRVVNDVDRVSGGGYEFVGVKGGVGYRPSRLKMAGFDVIMKARGAEARKWGRRQYLIIHVSGRSGYKKKLTLKYFEPQTGVGRACHTDAATIRDTIDLQLKNR